MSLKSTRMTKKKKTKRKTRKTTKKRTRKRIRKRIRKTTRNQAMQTASIPTEKDGKEMESQFPEKILMLTIWMTSCVLINTKNSTEENQIETTIEEAAQADDVDIQQTKSYKIDKVNT